MTDISVSDFMNDAANLAHRAVSHDKAGPSGYAIATYFYRESINLLDRAKTELLRRMPEEKSNSMISRIEAIENSIKQYNDRINSLEKALADKEKSELHSFEKKSSGELKFNRAKFLVNQALEEDELGKEENAISLYSQAVEVCIEAKSEGDLSDQLKSQVIQLAKQALERAEQLKGINRPDRAHLAPSHSEDSSSSTAGQPDFNGESQAGSLSLNNLAIKGNAGYSDEEKQVLLQTSTINKIEYLPFMQVDLKEKFAYPLPYSDKKGLLALSPKQRKHFVKWARPDDIWAEPKMFVQVDCFSIKQTIVSDCSFVASLAISALYEKRFKKKLISAIIYPQNKAGDPVFNPCGKYMVKLMLNGVRRKVIIDDFLPIGEYGQLLCSYSNNKGELWVSLLEKAYMKVMGGYDFPGSNSNIDLYALTGWIPERLSISSTEGPNVFNKDEVFRKLFHKLHQGQVLVTVATGEMSDSDADRAGLVSTHAYAVLDIREVQGVRLFLLKNPWSHLRWKGNYSELDAVHWTPQLKEMLNYDPASATAFDNGVFWIDFDSICKFFDVFYMSWNPTMFTYTYCIHKTWKAGLGPVKDVYNIGDNPQYRLETDSSGPATVWVLLTRHITDIEDFKENREYITVLVFDTDGKRVYYPNDPPPIIDGVRINSPHYLCKIPITGGGKKRYTLVVSQYAKMHTIHYTLRTYSSCRFAINEIVNKCTYNKRLTGIWQGRSAGGCQNHPETFRFNPCYQLALKTAGNNNTVIIDIKAPKNYQVGFEVICSNVSDNKSAGFFTKTSSGSFRSGFAILELPNIPSGIYHIIPSTFLPGQEGNFFLNVQATCDFTFKLLPSCDA